MQYVDKQFIKIICTSKSIYHYIQIRVKNLYELKNVQSINNLYYRITFFIVWDVNIKFL